MLKGLKYFIILDNGIIQMIDAWTFLHEFSDKNGIPDYESWVYEEAYLK